MPKRIAPLSDTKIRKAKAQDKTYKLSDGFGLYLDVSPAGGKHWKFKYQFHGRERKLSLGPYPMVTLAEAREAREVARKKILSGVDPSMGRRKIVAQSDYFEAVALEWYDKHAPAYTESHMTRQLGRLKQKVFPYFANMPIQEIGVKDLLDVLNRIEDEGVVETAHRVRGVVGQVFRYAIATGRVERDITVDLRGALRAAPKSHFAAITDKKELGELLNAVDDCDYRSQVVKLALQLLPLVFLRPGELRNGRWEEVDFTERRWNIPAARMKTGFDHVVPLSSQVVELLKRLHAITGCVELMFPGYRGVKRPISDAAMNVALRRLGYGKEVVTGHGFRATARTLLDEELGFRVDMIEHQLAHAVKDANGRAYNRTKHLKGRAAMMQRWADYLDSLKG